MNCDSAEEWIEPLAAGEIELSSELRAHIEGCPRCATGLSVARQINQSLASTSAQAPRHFTATVLQSLPSRATDVEDGLEAWFHTVAALSLLPVIAGIWFLADPVLLRQTIDTIGSVTSAISGLILDPGTMLITYVAIAAAGAIAVSLGLFEETT